MSYERTPLFRVGKRTGVVRNGPEPSPAEQVTRRAKDVDLSSAQERGLPEIHRASGISVGRTSTLIASGNDTGVSRMKQSTFPMTAAYHSRPSVNLLNCASVSSMPKPPAQLRMPASRSCLAARSLGAPARSAIACSYPKVALRLDSRASLCPKPSDRTEARRPHRRVRRICNCNLHR
ncbi:hypothetical protein Terro_3150 [Terriglobus roseus DSM 18391]|uniref:Uncharacterized protein n=1 Tax=Terriglobus roseus (strain DSM 18391 / NRRL B-41598 / KBS 63) TaxID=926566 RepID=I3ZJG1_TERRK|nr:hypothetical protein Terro_3150 [Terriglobus roseus DSM 18391]